jgi:putative tryptophan/tyrosine transport system substrate-binding protein
MRRREFITLLGSSAVALPVAAQAQQAMPVVGILHEGLPAPLSLTTAFQQGLIEGGISQGSSIKIEDRWAEGRYNRLPALVLWVRSRSVGCDKVSSRLGGNFL